MDRLRSEDRAAIGLLTTDYAYAVDAKDWAAFEGLFLPDAVIDYRSSGGITGSPSDVAAWMPDAMALFSWTMHSMSTEKIVFTGDDAATGSVHVLARHGLTWEGSDELMDVSAIYRDSYVRTDEGWRFSSRTEDTFAIVGGAFAALVRESLTR